MKRLKYLLNTLIICLLSIYCVACIREVEKEPVFLKEYQICFCDEEGNKIHCEYVKEGGAIYYQPVGEIATKETQYMEYPFEKWVTEPNGGVEADLSCVKQDMTVYASYNASGKCKFNSLDCVVDFVVDVPTGRDARILQLTDTQLYGDTNFEERVYKYIRQTVESTQPDLIILTGDIIYGYFDKDGTFLQVLVNFMENFNIPWAPVFGNHDNESAMGVAWQCDLFSNAENCLFKRGQLTGNGNYNIAIRQADKIIKLVYMMDSNGCVHAYEPNEVCATYGFAKDQIEWLADSSIAVDTLLGYNVSKILGMHTAISEYSLAAYEAGYQQSPYISNDDKYVIGGTVEAKNGDFGSKAELYTNAWYVEGLWGILKAHRFDGIFVGHDHVNNTSILYDGIRLTYGLKSSTYDYHEENQLGGTLISINKNNGNIEVEHCYYQK